MSWRSNVPERLKDLVGIPLGLRSVRPAQQWQRIVMNRAIDSWLAARPTETLSAVEVSGNERRHHRWATYDTLAYPSFDLCALDVDQPATYDIVVCEQVIEHVPDPWRALQRLGDLAAAGGHVIVSTPFLIRVHAGPGDYWRFTEDGLRLMIERAGLIVVESGSWGNRACARANLRRWAKRRWWNSLDNDPKFPVAVWVVARKPI